ncbi:MAG: alpha/beta hydrolase [Ignavibacteria bacterium]|jgi:acetyl esterase/lipase
MKQFSKILFISLLFISNTLLFAQVKTINVWGDKIPGAIENNNVKEEVYLNEQGSERTRYVTNPTLSIFSPPREKANGTAVIVCPGGGYVRLSIPPEGVEVAEWLNKQGIAAFVLKYRLPNDEIMQDKSVGPLQDVQEAIRIVRRNAEEWGIKPDKIGIMGFSAGGHLASTASTHYNEKVYEADATSARPDFSILIYPVISMKEGIAHPGSKRSLLGETPDQEVIERFSNELQIDENTPPAFLIHSEDDETVPVENSINYFLALRKYKIPAELHLYEKGWHGYGLAKESGGTESNWPDACLAWLKAKGLL